MIEPMLRPRLPLFLLALLVACGSAQHGGGKEILSGLPERKDPAYDLADDNDLERVRHQFDARPVDLAERARLWKAYEARLTPLLLTDRERAFQLFRDGIGLWRAAELADRAKAPADLVLVVPVAEKLYAAFGATGGDVQTVTALAVLLAAQPEKQKEHEARWNDIAQGLDDMAVAEGGEGAKRSRTIVVLDEVVHHFPSRFAGDTLVKLLLERQQAVIASIQGGQKTRSVLGSHRDPGVARPAWALIRTYALTGRLAEAKSVVDGIADKFGDEPELRRRLDAALAGQDGKAWAALAGPYVDDDPDEGDRKAALAICEAGAVRLPKAVEPRTCAAELARVLGNVPRALVWAEQARALDPKDPIPAQLVGRLLIMTLADEVTAERVAAAKQTLGRAEKHFAETDPLFKGKEKPELTLADAYVTMGRGLLNLGEVAEARVSLERAEKLGAGPAVTEQLATIAFKTGRWKDAARGFEQAAKAPRDTPLEQQFEQARLYRLAGEAWAGGGVAKEADLAWKRSLGGWEEILSAQLIPRARSEALEEVGRVLYHLGKTDDAMQAFARAIDVDSDEESVYGDVIAFLIPRGHFNEALDTYHRAIARQEVTTYLKLYLSLWISDAARVRGLPIPQTATDYLGQQAAHGHLWQNELARFAIGDLDWKGLYAKADTRGKRAEAYFYQAMRDAAAGDRASAEDRLRGVVHSDMLGFFEFEMARYYLAHGLPAGKKSL
jgi:tetratricopeptide (TPR) repeat protein